MQLACSVRTVFTIPPIKPITAEKIRVHLVKQALVNSHNTLCCVKFTVFVIRSFLSQLTQVNDFTKICLSNTAVKGYFVCHVFNNVVTFSSH